MKGTAKHNSLLKRKLSGKRPKKKGEHQVQELKKHNVDKNSHNKMNITIRMM
jgi:hypothetical protein